jgi:hypothetical protein
VYPVAAADAFLELEAVRQGRADDLVVCHRQNERTLFAVSDEELAEPKLQYAELREGFRRTRETRGTYLDQAINIERMVDGVLCDLFRSTSLIARCSSRRCSL